MSHKPRSSINYTTQQARFIKPARKLGADENEDAFKAKLAVIARQKPKDNLEPEKGE